MKDYNSTVRKFVKEQGLTNLIDTQVLEKARIARVPCTKHLKTGHYAIYTDGFEIADIIMASKSNMVLVDVSKKLEETKILDYLDLTAKPVRAGTDKTYKTKYEGYLPTCVVRIMTKLIVEQHATHDERKHLVGYLQRFRYSTEEILEYLSHASDYNVHISEDQIDSLVNYVGYTCANVKLLMPDICPGNCDYIRDLAKRKDP